MKKSITSDQTTIVDYSIVIPVYNEQENVEPLLKRLEKVMANVKGTHEIVIVDNGSFDGTPVILDELIGKYPSLVIVTLSRNFGYDGAIATGLEYTRGCWAIIMDGDQQDPPEVIPEFIEKAKEGYSIVYGIRTKRTEGWFLAMQMKAFYRIWNRIANIEVPKNAGNFCIMSRDVVDIINCMPERNKFIRGLRAWTGYPSAGIVYHRNERKQGKTKFSFFAYVNNALNGITSFSTVPLRMFTYLGTFGLITCIMFGFYVILIRALSLFGVNIVDFKYSRGWATLSLLILTLMSVNFLGLGILGEYIGRIFEEVKNRPNSLVRKVVRSSDRKTISKTTVEA